MAESFNIRNEPDFLKSFRSSLRGPKGRRNPGRYGKNTGLLRFARNNASEMFIKSISHKLASLGTQRSNDNKKNMGLSSGSSLKMQSTAPCNNAAKAEDPEKFYLRLSEIVIAYISIIKDEAHANKKIILVVIYSQMQCFPGHIHVDFG